MIAASSSLRALSSSRNANRICVRLASDVSRHAGQAAAATSITARASSTFASATSPVTAPLAGLVTGEVALLAPAKISLLTQWVIVGTEFLLAVLRVWFGNEQVDRAGSVNRRRLGPARSGDAGRRNSFA